MEWWTPTQDPDQLFFDVFYSVPEFSYSNPFDTDENDSTLITVEYQQKLFETWNLQLAFLHSDLDRDQVDSIQENLRGQLQDPKVAFAPPMEELNLPHVRSRASFDPFSGIVSQSGRQRTSDLQNTSFQAVITGEINFSFVKNRLLAGFPKISGGRLRPSIHSRSIPSTEERSTSTSSTLLWVMVIDNSSISKQRNSTACPSRRPAIDGTEISRRVRLNAAPAFFVGI